MKKIICSLIFIATVLSSCEKGQTHRLFAGRFTKPGEKGMHIFDFNDKNGELTPVSQADVGPNPSYFCFSDRSNLLYVANEVMEFNGSFGGGLTTYKYKEDDASFEKQNEMLTPYGGPCFISMSPDSGYLFLANYPNGSVVVVKLSSDGIPETITDTILYVKSEPDVSHAHMIMNDPARELVYVTDLGQNKIFRYDFDSKKGLLLPLDTLSVPDGYGPRHFDFSNDGTKLYVINELGSKITVFSVHGKPELIQTVNTIREGFDRDNYCADLHVSSNGKYIYGSNRGENSIVTFEIMEDGTLKLVGHTSCGGNWPRNFSLDPSGKFLLVGNQKSDSIAVFRIGNSGMPVEPPQKYHLTSPACLKFY